MGQRGYPQGACLHSYCSNLILSMQQVTRRGTNGTQKYSVSLNEYLRSVSMGREQVARGDMQKSVQIIISQWGMSFLNYC